MFLTLSQSLNLIFSLKKETLIIPLYYRKIFFLNIFDLQLRVYLLRISRDILVIK